MTDSKELDRLIQRIKCLGAIVVVDYDYEAALEGREVISSVQIENVEGIGPYTMSPIAAAEAMYDALYKHGG